MDNSQTGRTRFAVKFMWHALSSKSTNAVYSVVSRSIPTVEQFLNYRKLMWYFAFTVKLRDARFCTNVDSIR